MIELLDAIPVIIDVDRETLMVNADDVEAAITAKTKAIILVRYTSAPL